MLQGTDHTRKTQLFASKSTVHTFVLGHSYYLETTGTERNPASGAKPCQQRAPKKTALFRGVKVHFWWRVGESEHLSEARMGAQEHDPKGLARI